ncbi:MAG TPA: PAS domain S-box protein [Hyphomonadaceae bacterium]|nr:PAS domain S-box protein [Hyphomonadaceae bacterium]
MTLPSSTKQDVLVKDVATPSTEAGSLGDIPDDSRFRLLVEAVTDYAIYMLDPSGVISSWNPGAQRAKGYTAAEILGKNFSQFYTEEDRRVGRPQMALEIAAREGRFENEGWRVRKDGTRFWAHVIIDPIRSPEGRLIGFAKITRDLTDQKRSREELRQSEERFRLLVQGVHDYAIYMLDPNGLVTNWNSGAYRIKGYTADEIVGQHFSRFYTEEDRDAGEPQRALEIAAREGRYEREGWRIRRNGERFRAHVIIDRILDDEGKVLGFAKITRDITERMEAQKELEQAREAFFQAQKMESIGQLTGGVAHDFNNLLMAVLSSLDLLRKRLPDDPRLTQLVDNAAQGAERGVSLIQRMLAFARRQELKVEPVDVPRLVRNLQELMQRTLGPTVAVEIRVSGKVGAAMADANQLELALINLAVNARDAMADGGAITIDVREQRAQPGDALPKSDYVVVAVKDTGEGMDEETLARATEPFFTTKGVGRGTGLGLSMVQGFAEQLSGCLKLRSRKGVGTTAEIWLPAADESDGQGVVPIAVPPPAAPAVKRPLVILAVDDDALVLMNTTAMLEDMGHTVIEAMSGAEALEVVRGTPDLDVVITDFAMPRMTGRDLVAAIHAQRPQLPVILATGYAELPSGAAVDAFRLSKPFGEPELARALDAVMEG